MSESFGDMCESKKDELLEAFLGSDLVAEAGECSESSEELRQARDKAGLEKFSAELTKNPRVLEGAAFEFLGSMILGGVAVVDKAAELMMDKNPAGYVNAIFKAADRCTVPYVKFALVRAVFRRYPGRYRPYILALGRELVTGEWNEHTLETTSWLLQKFGAELLPDLVTFMHCQGHAQERVQILKEAVQRLGAAALPVVSAAVSSDQKELADAGEIALKQIGQI